MAARCKKEYRQIEGVPALARAARPFLSLPGITRLVITVPAGDVPRARELLSPFLPVTSICFVEGGETRQESVLRGLRALREAAPDLVLIHDGARPWVTPELIARVRAATERMGACVPVMEVSEAVKQVDDTGMILQHYERSSLRLAQTPQGFSFPRILRAHETAREKGTECVDDGEIWDRYVGPVAWVPGMAENRKITWSWDLEEP
jgi:2-C-methyl-D-erythritol 4-phosphate cytidylyltransferase/2-C-methyl-D-erythritol 2,4-cyclodiphosphate synthase